MVTVQFVYNGIAMAADADATIAEALVSNGVRVGNYSVRLRRWREEYHPFREVPSAWVTVDGVPNVNAYRVRVQNGMEIASQTKRNILASIASRWGPGFYYRKFKKPEFVRKLFFSGIERNNDYGGPVNPNIAINNRIAEFGFSDARTLDVDVLLIGAGRAGIAASLAIAPEGASVVMLDRMSLSSIEKVHGHVIAEAAEPPQLMGPAFSGGQTFASVLAAKGITLMPETTVFGYYEGVFAAVSGESRIVLLKPRLVALCAGSEEIKPRFRNNDLPGIMTAASFIALPDVLKASYAKGDTTLFTESRVSLHETAEIVSTAHVKNLVIGYECDEQQRKRVAESFSIDVTRVFAGTIASADGRRSVEQVTVRTPEGNSVQLTTELLIVAGRRQPRIEIPCLMDMPLRFDDVMHMPLPAVDETFSAGNVFVCGSLAGMSGRASIASGLICGSALSERLGRKGANGVELELWQSLTGRIEKDRSYPDAGTAEECVLCPCVDVTAGDVADAIAGGYDTLNMIKRYTGLFMGPCQGARCMRNSLEVFSALSGRDADMPTVRSPITPVYLGALALAELQGVVDRQ